MEFRGSGRQGGDGTSTASASSRGAGLGAALLIIALILALSASAARTAAPALAAPSPIAGQRAQLLLFHGGSFLFDDPGFEALTRARAEAAGFVPHYVDYPLGDLPAAVRAAEAEAKRLRDKYGLDHVYAYGASAGGTLASLLAGYGVVSAAVAKAPVADLVNWEFPTAAYGLNYDESIGVDAAQRYSLSPINAPAKNPVLIYQGVEDRIVPPAMDRAYAAKYPQVVHYWSVPGAHTTERVRPYLVTRTLDWLARVAAAKING
jgi:pimeloyl-ACP methyl ester carboxylesterase